MRKVIQIAFSPETEELDFLLYALCDDGTMWAIGDDAVWHPVVRIPQTPIEELEDGVWREAKEWRPCTQ